MLTPAWSISFEINPYSTIEGWSNVIHFTTGGNAGTYGFRIPAVFVISRSSRLHICSAINGNNNVCFNSNPLPWNEYTRVEISQVQQDNTTSFLYTISIGENRCIKWSTQMLDFLLMLKCIKQTNGIIQHLHLLKTLFTETFQVVSSY